MLFSKQTKADFSGLNEKLDTVIRKLHDLDRRANDNHSMQVDEYLRKNLFENPKYKSDKRLGRFEYQVFSQFGEDGIIAEIFNRIGTTNKFFIEFGVENGNECNSVNLLLQGWKGLWIEGSSDHVAAIQGSFKKKIEEKNLTVLNNFITAENIEELFRQGNALTEPDLLSIDIDRNDYYIWNAINNYRPRVIVIEYNAIFRPGQHFVVNYDPNASWDGSSNFGASLESYYQLGLQKGYKLVGCNFAGVNAFFVREDLIGNYFESPYTPLVHYEPARYFLYKKDGHYRKFDH